MAIVKLICKQCAGQMEVDDSRTAAFCVFCGTRHIIKDNVNITNNYYGSSAGRYDDIMDMLRPTTGKGIERAKNYSKYIRTGSILLFIGIVLAFMGFTVFAKSDWYFGTTTPDMGIVMLGGFLAFIGLALLALGYQYRYVYEREQDRVSPNVREGFRDTASMSCRRCRNPIDSQSEYCKFCGARQR